MIKDYHCLTIRLKAQADNAKQERRERLRQIPYDYTDFLEKRAKGYIVSERLLPHPKVEIVQAFLFSIANAKSKLEMKLLSDALTTLAFFQDIGTHDSIDPPDIYGFDMDTKAGVEQYLKAYGQFVPLFETMSAKVNDDFKFFADWQVKAIAANEYLWPPLKKWWERMRDKSPVLTGPPEWIDFPEQITDLLESASTTPPTLNMKTT